MSGFLYVIIVCFVFFFFVSFCNAIWWNVGIIYNCCLFTKFWLYFKLINLLSIYFKEYIESRLLLALFCQIYQFLIYHFIINLIFFSTLSKLPILRHFMILIFKRSKYSSAYRLGYSVRRRRSGHLLRFIEFRLRMKFLVSVTIIKFR